MIWPRLEWKSVRTVCPRLWIYYVRRRWEEGCPCHIAPANPSPSLTLVSGTESRAAGVNRTGVGEQLPLHCACSTPISGSGCKGMIDLTHPLSVAAVKTQRRVSWRPLAPQPKNHPSDPSHLLLLFLLECTLLKSRCLPAFALRLPDNDQAKKEEKTRAKPFNQPPPLQLIIIIYYNRMSLL